MTWQGIRGGPWATTLEAVGRGLHSFTFQLKLSRF
jgi:hypothetical protein